LQGLDRLSGSKNLNIENTVIDILEIARLSPHYDVVSLEGGLIEIDQDTGNEQPPDTKLRQQSFFKSHFRLLYYFVLFHHCCILHS
jgi:hypothetical protein